MMRYNRSHLNDTVSQMRYSNCGCNRTNGNGTCRKQEISSTCVRCENQNRTTQCNARKEPPLACEGERLLSLIRRLDFALVEINLYLDTHPYSQTALRYFEQLLCERNQAAKQYETTFGPLTAATNGMRDEWMWSTGAWPWQIEKENKR